MKVHVIRLLAMLPELCASPLVKRVAATFGDEEVGPILQALVEANSVQVCTARHEDVEVWGLYEKDSIRSIRVWIDVRACRDQGLEPQLTPLLAHLETEKRRRK